MGLNQVKEEKINRSSEDLLADAVNEVTAKKPRLALNLERFVNEIGAKFIEKKLEEFPRICEETQRVNLLKYRQYQLIGNSKRWHGKKKTFKFDYEIPRDLYFFMQNLVYKEFWSEENEKHWRPFMKAILAGRDPEQTLVRVKMKFGSNQDTSLIY